MNVGEPFRDHSNLPKALQRRVEEAWRKKRQGARPRPSVPNVAKMKQELAAMSEELEHGRSQGS